MSAIILLNHYALFRKKIKAVEQLFPFIINQLTLQMKTSFKNR